MLRIMWNATLAEVRGREKAKGTQQAKPQAGPAIKPPTAVRPTNSTK
jgi:hypothetical protein